MKPETLGQLFWARVGQSPNRVAHRVKREGAWRDVSWRDVGEEVRELAIGLEALGRQPGDSVAIVSQSRAEWVRGDFAVLSAGGITIPVYPTYPAEAVTYIVRDAEVRTLLVEDAGQLDKALAVAAQVPAVDSIVLMEGALPGRRSGGPRTLDWQGLRDLGRAARSRAGAALETRLRAGRSGDVATIVYTSGTTGSPKGVVQTHGNHLATLRMIDEVSEIREGDVHLLFLPLAHSFARMESFLGVSKGLTTAFAESLERLPENLREVRPQFICSVPRVFEKVYARILSGVAAAPPARRRIFDWAIDVGRRVGRLSRERRPVPLGLRVQHRIAERLVFRKLQAALGGRLRFCVSGGAPLSPEIAEFFHAAGILILEGYGLTETCPILASNQPSAYKFGTVGRAFPGVEIRIAEDGEILARGPNVAQGYHRKVEETAAVFQADGWFHTGDVGEVDAEGFLRITDRKKDLIKTSGGSYIAPQVIENLLKGDPFVSQVVVEGDRRPYPVALITVNPEELQKLARERGLGTRPAAELVGHPAVQARVRGIVDAVNAHLASYSQLKRFAVLPGDFTQDGGELTPTLKIKRREVRGKYADVIESLYRPA